jgi:hypothetical protein
MRVDCSCSFAAWPPLTRRAARRPAGYGTQRGTRSTSRFAACEARGTQIPACAMIFYRGNFFDCRFSFSCDCFSLTPTPVLVQDTSPALTLPLFLRCRRSRSRATPRPRRRRVTTGRSRARRLPRAGPRRRRTRRRRSASQASSRRMGRRAASSATSRRRATSARRRPLRSRCIGKGPGEGERGAVSKRRRKGLREDCE